MISGMPDLLTRHGPKLAVGGLVALNLVLIGALVLRDPVRTAVSAAPVPASSSSLTPSLLTTTPSSTPDQTPSTSSSTTPSPSPSPFADRPSDGAGEPDRLLAVNSGRVAWRANSTDCGGSAVVDVTTNGGSSWSRTKPGLTAIVRLKAYGDGSVFAIGADDQCRPTYAWITGPEQQWQRDPGRVENTWYRSPDDPDEVHAPGGSNSRPCGDDLLDLAGLGTFEAAVLCTDGRVRTEAEGRSWKTVQNDSKSLSLNADDNEFVSAGTRSDCSGIVFKRFDRTGAGLDDKGICRSQVRTSRGTTAVSVRAQRVWLWAGDQILTY